MNQAKSFEQAAIDQTTKKRPVYEYPIPEKYRNEYIKESLGFVKLLGDEELEATTKAHGDSVRLGFELVKQCIVECDGKRINRSNGDDERIWKYMDPALRNLCLNVYAELHTPEDSEVKDFLASGQVKIG